MPSHSSTNTKKNDGSNAFKLFSRCHRAGALKLNPRVKKYTVFALVFLVLGVLLFFIVSWPPSDNPPKGPIEIGAGPCPEATFNKTEVYVDVPLRSLDVRVTFRFNETEKYFIYVLLPYQAVNASAYAIHQSAPYPPFPLPGKPDIGNLSTHLWFNATTGSSIVNASLDINPDFPWLFGYPDMKDELTLGVSIKTEDSLVAIAYPLGASQSVILTFFGDYSGTMSNEMYAFMQPRSQPTLGQPFTVHMRLPPSTYFSDSQPSPIEYYIKQDSRWLMFSLDFIEGRYAQTLYCTFTYPTGQSLKEIMVFVGGGFVALATSFGVEAYINRGEKKTDSTKDGGNGETQSSKKKRASKTTDLLEVQIYADRSHAKLTSLLSFIFAYFIGLMVLFYTVLYQSLGPSPVTTWVVGLIGTASSTVGLLAWILWDYSKDVKAISRMIEAVKQGKSLPELEKLSRKSVSE
jgi:hypothetical protein